MIGLAPDLARLFRRGHVHAQRVYALRRCRAGVTAVEFALAAPVLLMLLLGIFDIGYMTYVNSVLHGAVNAVARNATVEGAVTGDEDAYVKAMVARVAPSATVLITRKSYYDFTDVGRPEAWNDTNHDGVCDDGEIYSDENRNGHWDADIGVSGNGGANDVILYTVTVEYKPLFPYPFGADNGMRTLSASTVRKNQPYANQASYGKSAGSCS